MRPAIGDRRDGVDDGTARAADGHAGEARRSSRLSFTHVASAVVASRAARSITSRSLVASSSFFYGAREHHAQHFLLLRVLPGLGLLHARFSSFRVERMRAGDVGSSAPSASTVGGAGYCRRPHVSHSVLLHTYRRISVTSHVRSLVCCAPSPAKQRPFGRVGSHVGRW